MAEENLDDFFAKKDKSKRKSKASKVTPDDILTKSDELYKKGKKKKGKEKPQTTSDTSNQNDTIGLIVNPQEEEEWKEVVEEQEKDYSGLRIANLQLSETKEEITEEGEVNRDDEDEDGEREDTNEKGPWKGPATATTPALAATQTELTHKVEEPKLTGKYVPPSQRAAAAAAASGQSPAGPTLPSHLRKKKAAPNIQSEFDFPSLGGTSQPTQPDSDHRSFEKVHHGGRQMEDPSKSSQQKLSLANKFAVLQD